MDKKKEVEACIDYINAIRDAGEAESVEDLLDSVACVYLSPYRAFRFFLTHLKSRIIQYF